MKITRKTIEYGLYFLVFILPFQTRWIIRQGTTDGWPYEFATLSLYATDVLLVVLLALNAYTKISSWKNDKRESVKISLGWWLVGGIELMTFISIFVAVDKVVALQAYLRLLLGIGLFWLVVGVKYDKQKLLNVFIASAAVQAALGIWQFLVQATFANKFLGMAKHLPIDIGDSVITAASGERWLRAYGSLDHPNMLGGLMAVALLMILVKRNKLQSVETQNLVSLQKIFYYVAILILTCGLFFSFSRAAWIGFFCALVIFTFIVVGRAPSVLLFRKREGLSSTLIIITTFLLLSFTYHDLISVRTLDGTVTENKSINDRMSSYKIDAEILRGNWLLGVGVGNYGLAVQNKFISTNFNDYQPVHNVYLLIFSEIGIFGLLCFCWLILYILYKQWKMRDIGSMLISISILLMFLFDHWWWSLHFSILFLFLVIGMLAKRDNN